MLLTTWIAVHILTVPRYVVSYVSRILLPCRIKETARHALAAPTNIYNNFRVSRFLLVVLPPQGYFYPALAIGQELVHKGHEVIGFGPAPRLDAVVCQ
jgi:hypothetical protein